MYMNDIWFEIGKFVDMTWQMWHYNGERMDAWTHVNLDLGAHFVWQRWWTGLVAKLLNQMIVDELLCCQALLQAMFNTMWGPRLR